MKLFSDCLIELQYVIMVYLMLNIICEESMEILFLFHHSLGRRETCFFGVIETLIPVFESQNQYLTKFILRKLWVSKFGVIKLQVQENHIHCDASLRLTKISLFVFRGLKCLI